VRIFVKPQSKRRWLLLALLFTACLAIVGFKLTPRQAPPTQEPVIFFKTPYKISTPRVGLLDRVMPVGPAWRWLWNLRYAIFGKTRTVDLSIMIIDVTGLDASTVTPTTQPDLTNRDGLQVWRTREADPDRVRQLLKHAPEHIRFSPRIQTGNQVQTSIHTGTSVLINGIRRQQSGLKADFLPIIRKNTLDLIATIQCSEPVTNLDGTFIIRTNVDLAGRFLLSQDAPGVLILATAPRSTEDKRLAIIVNSKVKWPKR
jgi:hypothetical protein